MFSCAKFDLNAGPATGIRITRLNVPRFVKNGTVESVVLDCEYELSSDAGDRQGLVVKWYLDNDPVPLYQWIPEISVGRHVGPKLRNRLDLFFTVPDGTDLNKFRALKLLRPTTELSGLYTCQVSSLIGQDSRSGNMTVFAPPQNVTFSITSPEANETVGGVECSAQHAFPAPQLTFRILWRIGLDKQNISELSSVETQVSPSPDPGFYDVRATGRFEVPRLPPRQGSTEFQCLIGVPGAYNRTRTISRRIERKPTDSGEDSTPAGGGVRGV
ncbi:unnamed protein product [Ixodes hexagonus]